MTPWIGLPEFEKAVLEKVARVDEGAKEIVAKASAMLIRAARANFVGSHARGTPTSAKPGEYPMIITGYARRSIISDKIHRQGIGAYYTHVGPTAIYARRLELGFPEGVNAYPYFQPAVVSMVGPVDAMAHEVMKRKLK
jgi:hypothetical protein